MEMDMFERATRARLRFPSVVGFLSTEDLWDLPLRAQRNNKPDLDGVAREIYAELQAIGQTDAGDDRPNPRQSELALALDVVTHVINIREADAARAAKATQRKQKSLASALGAEVRMDEKLEPQRVLCESELRIYDGLQKTQRAVLIMRGAYPKPVRISTRRKVWIAHEIAAWQAARIKARAE